MNNNTVIDRFENDDEADYPYKRDHRGYNAYIGTEVVRGLKVSAGHLNEWLLSNKRKSRSSYAVLTGEKGFSGIGKLRIFDHFRIVKDNIPDNLVLWQQQPNTLGAMAEFSDPLVAQNTTINTFYTDFSYTAIDNFNWINKLKYETHHQRKSRPRFNDRSTFFGLINKADYTWKPLKDLATKVRLKSMFRNETPFQKSQLKRREIWEIASTSVGYPLLAGGWIEAGIEYADFSNLIERPLAAPLGYIDDFHSIVYVLQYSNTADYLGYRLTSKVGFRQQTRYFEDTLRTSNIIFVQIFAGVTEE